MCSQKQSNVDKSLLHKVLKIFKDYKIQDQKLILAISGGIDSIALMNLMKEISRIQNLNLHVVYVHHGDSDNSSIQNYRDNAEKHIVEMAKKYSMPFTISDKPSKKLSSELDFRNFRYRELKNILKDKKISGIILAHNSDDVLETRFIHLMRGSGEKGFQSIAVQNYFSTSKIQNKKDAFLFRPLLFTGREEIKNYIKKKKIKYIEDPSNKEDRFLRNWLRQKLFPMIEKKRPGSIQNLSRSFMQISSFLSKIQKEQDLLSPFIDENKVKRIALLDADPILKRYVLASYMHKNDLKNYGLKHIDEILKQVSRKQKQFCIKLLNKTWYINENFISLQKDVQNVKKY